LEQQLAWSRGIFKEFWGEEPHSAISSRLLEIFGNAKCHEPSVHFLTVVKEHCNENNSRALAITPAHADKVDFVLP
jgi:hypothetical protein